MDFTPTEEEKSLLSLLLSGEESSINLAKTIFAYSNKSNNIHTEEDFLYKFGYLDFYINFNSFSKEILDLYNVRIQNIPQLSNATKKLILGQQKISVLPNNLPDSIIELNCYGCEIVELPNKLPNSLHILICAKNKLITLPEKLPKSLSAIDCSYNYITALPENLPENLKYLNCEHNSLKVLPEKLPKNLTSFAYNGNKISKLPINPPSGLKTIYINSSTPDKYIEEYENKYPNIEIKLR